jgi:hypothetical protein
LFSPENAQRCRDGATARRQDGTGEQQRDVRPGRRGEDVDEPGEAIEEAPRERIG